MRDIRTVEIFAHLRAKEVTNGTPLSIQDTEATLQKHFGLKSPEIIGKWFARYKLQEQVLNRRHA